MWLLIIFGVCGVFSLIIILFFFIKKYSQLRLLSPESVPDIRDKKKKKEIIRGRIERVGLLYATHAKKYIAQPIWQGVQYLFRTVAGKLTSAERFYKEKQKKQQVKDITPEQLLVWVEEGRVLLAEGAFEKAEKKLIDVIGIDTRCVPAYELLGQVYLKHKDYQLAEETFQFLCKLAPMDASVRAYLGEAYELLGQKDDAFASYQKAAELSPRNPRYLDFAISMAIEMKKTKIAKELLWRLKEANPENQKIGEFEERIHAIV